MTGHTKHTVISLMIEMENRVQPGRTFLEPGMPSESDLVPHITHSVRTSNLGPMVEEVLHLNLFKIVSCTYTDLYHNNSPFEQLQKWPRMWKRPRMGHSPP
jgi:hypothetical protein